MSDDKSEVICATGDLATPEDVIEYLAASATDVYNFMSGASDGRRGEYDYFDGYEYEYEYEYVDPNAMVLRI